MASLRKFSVSRYWFACFTMPDGRRVQRTTKETDRKKAQRLADQFEEASRARQTARAAQRVISEIYTRTTGEGLPSSTVRAHFEGWLARKGPETAASTGDFYAGKARRFLAFLGPRADEEIARFTTPDVLAFRKAEAERVAPSTANDAVKVVRMIFEQAKRDGLVTDNPADGVALLKERKDSPRRPFTLDEMELLLAETDPEWRSLVLFGFYTGARLGDIARLRWGDLNLTEGGLRYRSRKTDRQMNLPLAAPLRRHLETLPPPLDSSQPLHPRAAGILGRQEDRVANLSNQFYTLMVKAGLVPRRPPKSRKRAGEEAGRIPRSPRRPSVISFHALRHTATSLMKNAGVSPAFVGEFIGHESEAMNRIYTHIEQDSLRRAADVLPDLVGGS